MGLEMRQTYALAGSATTKTIVLLLPLVLMASSTTETAEISAATSEGRAETVKMQTPVIGVITQVLRDYKRFVDDRRLHLPSSYVKWIESSGAQVLPIQLNQDDDYYERVFNQTNGLLFPGGDNLLDPKKDTPMLTAARKLYRLAVEANDRGDFYPIWGTCLGLELLSVLTSGRNRLVDCSANDISLKVDLVARGKLFAPAGYFGVSLGRDFAAAIVDVLRADNVTYNFHHKCLTDEALREAGLGEFYRPLAYSDDKNGLRFISILEAVKYPFYAVQFHPEKPPFEFVLRNGQRSVPHSGQSIAVSRYFADFFVAQAQKSSHKASNLTELRSRLIYSYDPIYTGLKSDMYEQRYLFPFKSNSLSTEEFLDYLPGEDEEAPETVSRAPSPTGPELLT